MKEIKLYFKGRAKFIKPIEEGSILRLGDKISDIYVYNGKSHTLYLHPGVITNDGELDFKTKVEFDGWSFDYSLSKLRKIDPAKTYIVSKMAIIPITGNTSRINMTLLELDQENKFENSMSADIITTTRQHPLGGNKKLLSIPPEAKTNFGNIIDITFSKKVDMENDFLLKRGEELIEIELELAILSFYMPVNALVKYSTLSGESYRNMQYLCEIESGKEKIDQYLKEKQDTETFEKKAKPYVELGLDLEFATAIAKGGNGKEIVKLWQSDWWQQYSTDDQLIQAVLNDKINSEEAQYLNSIRSDFHELVSVCLDGRASIDWVKTILDAGFSRSPEGVNAILNGGDPEVVAMLLNLKINVGLLPPPLE